MKLLAKFVHFPRTAEQNDHVSLYTDFRERAQNDPNFMSSKTTADENWVYGHDPETKQMSTQWKTIISTEKSEAGEVQCQDRVDCVLRHRWAGSS